MSIRHGLASPVLISAMATCASSQLFADAVVSDGDSTLGDRSVMAGESIQVIIYVSQVSDLYAYQLDYSWDPAFLRLVAATPSEFPGPAFTEGRGPTNGTASFAASLVGTVPGLSSYSGGGLGLVLFDFEGLAPGTSPLILSDVTLLDSEMNPIPFSTVNDEVMVFAPEPRLMPMLRLMLASAILAGFKFAKQAS
jgi:cohesin domain-containing protein